MNIQSMSQEAEDSSPSMRKGKWSQEEEDYALALINNFEKGLLQIPEGTTLRMYLAERLNCDPMRITKKFTGQNCLGKKVHEHRLNLYFKNFFSLRFFLRINSFLCSRLSYQG
jgi:hypothetical protein